MEDSNGNDDSLMTEKSSLLMAGKENNLKLVERSEFSGTKELNADFAIMPVQRIASPCTANELKAQTDRLIRGYP